MRPFPLRYVAPLLLIVGCGKEKATVKVPDPAPVVKSSPPPAAPPRVEVPQIALLEPYLVIATALPPAPPPTLRGRILPNLPIGPITPLPPLTGTPPPPEPQPSSEPKRPVPSSPVPEPTPKRSTLVPNAFVRLLQEERARRVEDAKNRLAASAVRATQTAAEAKRLWGYVKDGFVAQKQAENADLAAKAAAKEQADAQKTLDEAQQRQRDARKDIESALRNAWVAPRYELTQLSPPPTTFQVVPNTFRLAVLGNSPVKITVQNGVVLKKIDPQSGEAGAWLIRCIDPQSLRVGIESKPTTLWIRRLPESSAATKV